jgi:hypothetical protein
MKITKIINNFLKKYYIHIITISTLITLIGFGFAITAEVKNQHLRILEDNYTKDYIDDKKQLVDIFNEKQTINTYGFTGLLMLFVGFLVTSAVQTYILFHTRKKILK